MYLRVWITLCGHIEGNSRDTTLTYPLGMYLDPVTFGKCFTVLEIRHWTFSNQN